MITSVLADQLSVRFGFYMNIFSGASDHWKSLLRGDLGGAQADRDKAGVSLPVATA
jgi:hypothetical protein